MRCERQLTFRPNEFCSNPVFLNIGTIEQPKLDLPHARLNHPCTLGLPVMEPEDKLTWYPVLLRCVHTVTSFVSDRLNLILSKTLQKAFELCVVRSMYEPEPSLQRTQHGAHSMSKQEAPRCSDCGARDVPLDDDGLCQPCFVIRQLHALAELLQQAGIQEDPSRYLASSRLDESPRLNA